MHYLEVPSGRLQVGANGDVWLDLGNANWAPVLPPAQEVDLKTNRADPLTELVVSRSALAVVLNYIHHQYPRPTDPQFSEALQALDMRMQA
jgi:hypothetical protein